MKLSPAGRLVVWLSLFLSAPLLPISAIAQDKDWRPVDPADLSSKTPKVDPDADAEALLWEVRVDDSSDEGFSMRNYVRVKIFTERGREKYSKFDIPFAKGLKIKDLAARVIRPDGSIVDVKPDDIFERDIVKASGLKIKAKSFAVPNIEPGVIVEYRYKESFSYGGAKGLHLDLQKDIPVQRLVYYYKPYEGGTPNYQWYNSDNIRFVKDKDGYWLASRTDVPALRQEPHMPPEDSVRAWMLLTGARASILDLSEESITYVVKDPGNPARYWGSVGLERSGWTRLMNKAASGDVKKMAVSVTAGAATADEKLRKLYEFCQTQINNTTYDPALTDEMREKLPKEKSVSDTFKRRSGSGPYIDLLFGAMARSLGFETAVVYTGDRSKIFFTPDMTNEELIHQAAVAVKVDGDWDYFDPGVKFLPYGMLVWFEEDTHALIVADKDYTWRQTPLSGFERSVTDRRAHFKLNDDGSLEGDVVIEMNGHPAVAYRMENYDETAAKREQGVADEVKGQIDAAELSNVSVENVMDASKPLVQKYHIRVPNYSQKTGKRLFLQPGYFKYGLGPAFTSSTRKYDIFFRYPWSENDDIEITWPAGYEVDTADAPTGVADPRDIGGLTVRIDADKAQNVLKYSRKFHFGGGGSILFGSQMYTPLKNMFDSFHNVDSHTITLKQKQ